MITQFTDEEKLVHIKEMREMANLPDLWNFEETKFSFLEKLGDGLNVKMRYLDLVKNLAENLNTNVFFEAHKNHLFITVDEAKIVIMYYLLNESLNPLFGLNLTHEGGKITRLE